MRYAAFSYGGSGITALRRAIKNTHKANVVFEDPTGTRSRYFFKHLRVPLKSLPDTRAVYLFSNPMNTVLSLFRRRADFRGYDFPRHHCEHMAGLDMPKNLSLEKFLKDGIDYFRFQDHWYHWVNCRSKDYQIMLVRYETMGHHVAEIARFLNAPINFMIFKKRASNWEDHPHKDNLYKMYGSLWKTIKAFDQIKII